MFLFLFDQKCAITYGVVMIFVSNFCSCFKRMCKNHSVNRVVLSEEFFQAKLNICICLVST